MNSFTLSHEEFQILWNHHAPWVRRLARRFVCDDSRADDVSQKVWLVAWKSLPKDRENLRPWFASVTRKIAYSLNRSETRRTRRECFVAREEGIGEAKSCGLETERNWRLPELLTRSVDPYRATLQLHFVEDLRLVEIAQRLSLPAPTVRTRLRRGLHQLRVHLVAKECEGGHGAPSPRANRFSASFQSSRSPGTAA